MKAHGLISAGLALTLTLAASPAVQAADTTAGNHASAASLTLTPGEKDQVNLGRPVESVTPKAGPASYHWENIAVDKETGKVSITAPAEPADQTGTGTAEYGEYTFNVVYADGETGTFTILFQEAAADPADPADEDEEGDGGEAGEPGDGGEAGEPGDGGTEPGDGDGDGDNTDDVEPGDDEDGEGEVEDDNNDDVEEKETEPGDNTDDVEPGEDGEGEVEDDNNDDERTDDKPAEESTDKNPLPQTSSSSADLSSFGSFLKTILSFLTRLFT